MNLYHTMTTKKNGKSLKSRSNFEKLQERLSTMKLKINLINSWLLKKRVLNILSNHLSAIHLRIFRWNSGIMWEIILRQFFMKSKRKSEKILWNTCPMIELNRRYKSYILLDIAFYLKKFRRKFERCHIISWRNSRGFSLRMKKISQDSGNKWKKCKYRSCIWKAEKLLKGFFKNSRDLRLLMTLSNRYTCNV